MSIISIEGNIGSGKSTLLKNLKNYCESPNHDGNYKKIIFLEEPVTEWENIKDKKNRNIIEMFYNNQKRHAFSFQVLAFTTILSNIKKAVEVNPDAIIVVERSIYTTLHIFGKMLLDSKKIEQAHWQIFTKLFESFEKDISVNKIVYVKTDPSICFYRIEKRARAGESKISHEYLENCDNYHTSMISKLDCDQLHLDGNVDIYEQPSINGLTKYLNLQVYKKIILTQLSFSGFSTGIAGITR